ncbi:MAG: DegV family protein [Massiliimalia sp.]|jgi:DegV family protein with EDD domain
MSYRLITDATADLTLEMTLGLPDMAVVPMEIIIEGIPYQYGPGGNITVNEFYQELRSGKFSATSQVNPMTYEDFFAPFLEAGEDILYLCFTSGMSGMYQNAKQCVDRLQKRFPERKIVCVDTKCASLGEGFLVREALIKQAEGFSLEELAQWISDHQIKICQWFTVDTFEHLKHGGRVSSTAAVIGTALQIKPLLHVSENGELEVVDRTVRGTKRAMAALLECLEKGWQSDRCNRIIVGHGGCPDVAEKFVWEIQNKYPYANIITAPIGPVIGSHTGPGMIAVVFWGSWR